MKREPNLYKGQELTYSSFINGVSSVQRTTKEEETDYH